MARLSSWDAQFDCWLDDAEKARAERFAFECDRVRYRRSHGLLRGLLARAVGAEPDALVMTAGLNSKPKLSPPSEVRFNLSHSGDRVLVAWSLDVEVGADIERIKPGIAFEGIAQRFFTEQEVAWMHAAPEPDTAFTCIWTRKEALIKAWGDGLAVDLRGFSVGLEGPEKGVTAPADCSAADRRTWWWRDLDVLGPYCAALACDGAPMRLQQHHWPSES